ncbi:hypothetical protein pb186bvf_000570 [Paramecium bursaria]
MQIFLFDQGDDSAILDVRFDKSTCFLYSSDKKTIKLWNIEKLQLIKTFCLNKAFLIFPTQFLFKFFYLHKPNNNNFKNLILDQDGKIIHNFQNKNYQNYNIYTISNKIEINEKIEFWRPMKIVKENFEQSICQEFNQNYIFTEQFDRRIIKLSLNSNKILQNFYVNKNFVTHLFTSGRNIITTYQRGSNTSRIMIYSRSKFKIIRQIINQSSQYFKISKMINRSNWLYCMECHINDFEKNKNLIKINIYDGQTSMIAENTKFIESKYDISINVQYLAIGQKDGMISVYKLI